MTEVTSIETRTSVSRFNSDENSPPSMSHVMAFGHSPETMLLQVRSTGKKQSVISSARLDLDAAIRLHAGLELWIEDQTRKEETAS